MNGKSETEPVRGVTIRGLNVGRFPSTGIIVLFGHNARVERVDAAGGADYGILLLRSTRSTVVNSTLHGGQTAGLYIGESPDALATVVGNWLFDNGVFGIFIRSSARGTIAANQTEGACMGFGFIPSDPAEDAVSDWRVTGNRITANNRLCNTRLGELAGVGVYLGGTKNVTVKHNRIDNNNGAPGSPSALGGGIVVNDGSLFGIPNQPIGNRIEHNTLRGNLPHDIRVLVPGTGNRFTGNRCEPAHQRACAELTLKVGLPRLLVIATASGLALYTALACGGQGFGPPSAPQLIKPAGLGVTKVSGLVL